MESHNEIAATILRNQRLALALKDVRQPMTTGRTLLEGTVNLAFFLLIAMWVVSELLKHALRQHRNDLTVSPGTETGVARLLYWDVGPLDRYHPSGHRLWRLRLTLHKIALFLFLLLAMAGPLAFAVRKLLDR